MQQHEKTNYEFIRYLYHTLVSENVAVVPTVTFCHMLTHLNNVCTWYIYDITGRKNECIKVKWRFVQHITQMPLMHLGMARVNERWQFLPPTRLSTNTAVLKELTSVWHLIQLHRHSLCCRSCHKFTSFWQVMVRFAIYCLCREQCKVYSNQTRSGGYNCCWR